MTDSRDKRATEIQDSIRQILFHDWDPIAVSKINPTLVDEYDSYIAPAYRILTGTRSEDELMRLLHQAENESVGMTSTSREQLRSVARRLLALNVRL